MNLTTEVKGHIVPVSAIRLEEGKYLHVTAVTLSQLGFSDKAELVLSVGEIIGAALEEKLEPVNPQGYDNWEHLLVSLFTVLKPSENLVLVTGRLGCLSILGSMLISYENAFFLNSDKLPRNRFIFIVDPSRVERRQEE